MKCEQLFPFYNVFLVSNYSGDFTMMIMIQVSEVWKNISKVMKNWGWSNNTVSDFRFFDDMIRRLAMEKQNWFLVSSLTSGHLGYIYIYVMHDECMVTLLHFAEYIQCVRFLSKKHTSPAMKKQNISNSDMIGWSNVPHFTWTDLLI